MEDFSQNRSRESHCLLMLEKVWICKQVFFTKLKTWSKAWHSNEGIFTPFSTGLLAHAVFVINTPFWKAGHGRKVYFCWNPSNPAETGWVDGWNWNKELSFIHKTINTADTSEQIVRVCENVLGYPCAKVTKYSPFSCRLHKSIATYNLSCMVPFNSSKKQTNIYCIGRDWKYRVGIWLVLIYFST